MSLITKRRDVFPSVYGPMLDDFFKDDFMMPSLVGNTVPAVNVSEEHDQFKIEVAVPGMEKGDFKLDLDHNLLRISCEKKSEEEKKDKKYTRREFSFSSFQRSFTLPESVNAEKVDATYKEGILQVSLPKKAEAQKALAREIKIA